MHFQIVAIIVSVFFYALYQKSQVENCLYACIAWVIFAFYLVIPKGNIDILAPVLLIMLLIYSVRAIIIFVKERS
jgi:hypothetical protein